MEKKLHKEVELEKEGNHSSENSSEFRSYGDVFKAEWRGIIVAVKKLPISLLNDPAFLKDFKSEVFIMRYFIYPVDLLANSLVLKCTTTPKCSSVPRLLFS